MNAWALWQRFQQDLCDLPELAFSLDYSRLSVPDEYFARLEPEMQKAFAAMERLERGGVANPDEKRRVGHYWLRDPRRAPTPALRREIAETTQEVLLFARRIHKRKIAPPRAKAFRNLLLIGIGGSALGPQFVSRALGSPCDPLRFFCFDNTDPDGLDLVLEQLETSGKGLRKTLCLVVSKSGGTKETRNGMLEAEAAYTRAGLRFSRHAVALTSPGSELDRYAEKQDWLARFPMWDFVGGRTSELSPVGLLPAALQGLDAEGLLRGARAMDAATRVRETRRNPAALLALLWHFAGNGRGEKAMVVLPYKDRLELFSRYLQQLVMESLGKELDLQGRVVHQGLTVYGNKGSTDQHAYVQQLRDGPDNFFVTFIEVLRDRARRSPALEEDVTSGDYLDGFLQGTRQALFEKGRGSITLTLPAVNARSVGALIALYERAVGLYALLIGINAYHQPGVEAGKQAAGEVLLLQRRLLAQLRERKGRFFTAEELAEAAGVKEQAETAFWILRHLAANSDKQLRVKTGATPFATRYGV